jgi:hypothetical protein
VNGVPIDASALEAIPKPVTYVNSRHDRDCDAMNATVVAIAPAS